MTTKRLVFAMLFACIAAPSLGARAAVPNLLNVQGVIRDAQGDVVSGTLAVRFSLHSAELGGTELWAETLDNVVVRGGVYGAYLGADAGNPLPTAAFETQPQLWLGVQVGSDDPLPRQRLVSVPYAHESVHATRADLATALSCTGCVAAGALGFDPATQGELDALAAAPLAEVSCAADAILVFDGSDWACSDDYATPADIAALGQTLGQMNCAKGDVPEFNGTDWTCNAPLFGLPANGLDEVSNGILTNEFQDGACSENTPLDIPNALLLGVSDILDFPDVGIAEELHVSVDILGNSDPNYLRITLVGPDSVEYVLWCGQSVPGYPEGECAGNAEGDLNLSFPEQPLAAGDLSDWLGRNPAGLWLITVVDHGTGGSDPDGQLAAWCVSTLTLSAGRMAIAGNVELSGGLTPTSGTLDVTGNTLISGDLVVGGAATVTSDFEVGGSALVSGDALVDGDLGVSGEANLTGGAIVEGGLNVTGTIRFNGVEYAPIPTGMISMFLGNCPTGWSEVQALRGRFPRGEPTGTAGSLGQGGDDNAVLVNHTHDVSVSVASGGAHGHGVSDPGHLHTLWSHNDDFNCSGDGEGNWGIARCPDNGGFGWPTSYAYATASATGVSVQSGGDHAHSASASATSTGVSGAGANMPAYQEVIFCAKN